MAQAATVFDLPSRIGEYGSRGFYPVPDAARLVGTSANLLRRWASVDLVKPTISTSGAELRTVNGYSFEDLFYLRVLNMLRHRVSLFEAAKTVSLITKRAGAPGAQWSRLQIKFINRKAWVYFPDQWGWTLAVDTGGTGQRGEERLLFPRAFRALSRRIDALIVPQRYWHYIEVNPDVRDGFPVLLGTSFETAVVKQLRDHGMSFAEMHTSFPSYSEMQLSMGYQFELYLDSTRPHPKPSTVPYRQPN